MPGGIYFGRGRATAIATSIFLCCLLLAGCSATNGDKSATGISTRSATTAKAQQLTGTMDDWIMAICEMGPGLVQRLGGGGVFMPGASNVIRCTSSRAVAGRNYMILAGYYASAASAERDLSLNTGGNRLGPYAQGWDPSTEQVVVFALRNNDPARALEPLGSFGFSLGRAAPPDPNPAEPPRAVPTAQPPKGQNPAGSASSDGVVNRRFKSRTGIIACDLFGAGDRGSATCEIRQHTFQPKVLPGCETGWPSRFELEQGNSVSVYCYRDTIFNEALPVLDYGTPLTVGAITCIIDRTSGVTCKDATTGHYFRASRDSYKYA
jgi:hypothetical protein